MKVTPVVLTDSQAPEASVEVKEKVVSCFHSFTFTKR